MTQPTDSVNRLVQLSQDIADYCEKITYGAYEQKKQAKLILKEIEKVLQSPDDWLILNIFESSIAPKLIKLAKDLQFYLALKEKSYLPSQIKSPTLSLQNQANAKSKEPLNESEHETVCNMLSELTKQLNK